MVRSIYRRAYIRRRRRRWRRRIFKSLLVLALFWGLGLLWFISFVPSPRPLAEVSPVDGVVVLTGGSGRIAAGLELLGSGIGKRLLISGVNSDLPNQTIHEAIGSRPDLIECCIDLGREAVDTRSNAEETLAWAETHAFTSVLVITSEYHMPRAIIELEALSPTIRIEQMSVDTPFNFVGVSLEYSKYLISLAQNKILR